MNFLSSPVVYSRIAYDRLLIAVGLLSLAAVKTALACSVCGCSLSSDWAAQGYSVMPGTEMSLRYEYYNQTELYNGRNNLDRSLLSLPDDAEIQQKTLTRSVWLGADYVTNKEWGVSFQLPYYNRFHTTIAPGDLDVSSSKATGLGDLRVLARYQSPDQARNWSVQFGLKLPTGRFNQNFATGPQAGNELDRGLQLGTGTTDALLGASYFARLGDSFGYFAQAVVQRPLTQRSGFFPSPSLNVNLGIRWLNTSRFLPQLQVNGRWDGREKGPASDYDNSGATLIDLSPGLTAELTRRTSAFGFVQVPIYQRVNGRQLEPRWLLSIGVRYSL